MRLAAPFAALVLAACESAPPAPPPPAPVPADHTVGGRPAAHVSWTATTPDRSLTWEQRELGEDRCEIVAWKTDPGVPEWISPRCIESRAEVRLVSPDGTRLMLVRPLPRVTDGEPRDAVVAVVHEAASEVRSIRLRDIPAARTFSVEADLLHWLDDDTGRSVRADEAGAVVKLQGGAEARLRFVPVTGPAQATR